jgi:transketolase
MNIDSVNEDQLKEMCRLVRKDVLLACERTFTGHVGSAFSLVEILVALYNCVIHGMPKDENRDRVILSKGHAAAALYAVLYRTGRMSKERYETFAQDGTTLGHHPHYEPQIGLEANTGSLGNGLSVAAGMAFAVRSKQNPYRIFTIVSDGETNEGSLWEAAAFAGHHKLSLLNVVVDANEMQAMGFTKDIIDQSLLAEKWRAFGWQAQEVDGHNLKSLIRAFNDMGNSEKPSVVIANTVKGKGVGFMERNLLWHYRQPRKDECENAMQEIDNA